MATIDPAAGGTDAPTPQEQQDAEQRAKLQSQDLHEQGTDDEDPAMFPHQN